MSLRAVIALLLCSSCCLQVSSDPIQYQAMPTGISTTIGTQHVQLSVASSNSFRLSVRYGTDAAPISSIFLDPHDWKTAAFSVVKTDTTVGIQTAAGRLLVNSAQDNWQLQSSTGKPLTAWSPLGSVTSSQGASVVTLPTVFADTADMRIYGSGGNRSSRTLLPKPVHTFIGNGVVQEPSYWCAAGTGELAISQSDDAPASYAIDQSGHTITWSAPGSSLDLYLSPAPVPETAIRAEADLTGHAPVPPLWAFGYFQSKWGWNDKAYIDDKLQQFRTRNFPVDTFIIDFEWYTPNPDYSLPSAGTDEYQDFTYNSKLFPDPAAQIKSYADQGLHVIGIRKPRVGNTALIVMAKQKGWIAPSIANNPYVGGDGTTVNDRCLNFSLSDVRAWYAQQNEHFIREGLAGFWNDEGDQAFTENAYWNMAEIDAFKHVDPDRRFWSLNRSFTPGMQHQGAAAWSGDIASSWDSLAETPARLLNFGLAGMPYSACDIGGFTNSDPDPTMLTRWIEAGVFSPIMRTHSVPGKGHYPWMYGDDPGNAMQKALDLRYRLIPYYYSLAYQNYFTGDLLMRPLVVDYPSDKNTFDLADEWMMGHDLLVAPILTSVSNRSVYLPAGGWYKLGGSAAITGGKTLNVIAALDDIPVYVPAGAILPLGPVKQYTGEPSTVPLEVQVYPGANGTFTLYEDDGKTLDYQKGIYRATAFQWNDAARKLTWTVRGTSTLPHSFAHMNVVLELPGGALAKPALLQTSGEVTF
jgi:alpha-glucosidase